jgi:hypothetical protein
MKQILSIAAVVIVAGILGTSTVLPYVDADRDRNKTMALRFIGDGKFLPIEERPILEGLDPEIQDVILDPDTLCYEVPLERLGNGKIIGTGLDCLSDIQADEETGAITLTDVTVFNIKKKVLVSVSDVTIHPNLTDDTENVTHITGSFPDEDNIVYGTKKFDDASGSVRLSGGVNMNEFPEKIVFDCIFVINFNEE